MFLQGLQDLGYVEGRDLQITYRSSDGYQDRLPALAEELVRLNPDVIVAAGLDAVVAARNVTQTIPIVSATLADAIHLGLIANEARPTGNVTGLEPYVAGLPAKQMEFAREIMPGKIGLLTSHDHIARIWPDRGVDCRSAADRCAYRFVCSALVGVTMAFVILKAAATVVIASST